MLSREIPSFAKLLDREVPLHLVFCFEAFKTFKHFTLGMKTKKVKVDVYDETVHDSERNDEIMPIFLSKIYIFF